MMFGTGYGFGWMWLWGLVAIVGLLLLVFVIVRVAAGGIKRNDASGSHPYIVGTVATNTPRQILEERYAKGELTTEEYRERVSVLGESPLGKDG